MIRAVLFDVGECLVDESREWEGWAAWLGVPRHTFSTQFGAIVAQGRDHRETFRLFRPGFDLAVEREKRDAVGEREWFGENDLYPDARMTIRLLRQAGLVVGIAANQSEETTTILRRLFTGYVDLIATSFDMGGIAKPEPRFFELLIETLRMAPQEILYVGDRLDEDIRPAAAAGLCTALIRRGPWGIAHQNHPEAATLPTMRIDGLRELTERIAKYNDARL
ncbi:HAD family hydrolase [Streptomyces hoynatensis]|uniref:HAD family hydrolase n=1 Tax=Streptomyces hoynatensis TaxID=1141874 RepID=A0A3A9Z4M1_9ACTN|nr:HAD family hydrolase [Streptomyces hoynatensis]RKN43160.1 HAD family hydrolase [Streptomyces hoynatensis]